MTQSASEYVDFIRAYQVEKARPLDCPLVHWLEARRDLSQVEVVADMVNQPFWFVGFSKEGLENACTRYEGDLRRDMQVIFANHIVAVNSDKYRLPMVDLLRRRGEEMAAEAVAILEAWVRP